MSDKEYGIIRFTRYSEQHENGGGLEMTVERESDWILLEPQLVEDVASGVPVAFAYTEDGGKTIHIHDDFGHDRTYQVLGPVTTESGFEGIEAVRTAPEVLVI